MKQKLKTYYPYIFLLLALCLLIILNLFFQDHWLDSDMAAEMIFSRLLAQEGHIFASPDWCYSTEFRFLYTHLIMGPLFRILNNWHAIRTITNLVFYGLLLVSYFYFLKPLKVSPKAAVLTSLLLLLPFSETMKLHMQIGNTYMSHVIIVFFYFGMFLRLWNSHRKMTWKKALLLFLYLALSVVCGISGIRYLLAMQCPLVLTAFLFCVRSTQFQELRRSPSRTRFFALLSGNSAASFYYSLLGFAGSILGYGVNVLYISRHYSFQTYPRQKRTVPAGADFHHFLPIDRTFYLLHRKMLPAYRRLLLLCGFVSDYRFLCKLLCLRFHHKHSGAPLLYYCICLCAAGFVFLFCKGKTAV